MKKVLFVCRSNAGRSQVAEAIFNKLTRGNNSSSAGFAVRKERRAGHPAGPTAIKVSKSMGYDLSRKRRKQLTAEMARKAAIIIVLLDRKERRSLPKYIVSSRKTLYWDVKDLHNAHPLSLYSRRVKRIEALVKMLAADLRGNKHSR